MDPIYFVLISVGVKMQYPFQKKEKTRLYIYIKKKSFHDSSFLECVQQNHNVFQEHLPDSKSEYVNSIATNGID